MDVTEETAPEAVPLLLFVGGVRSGKSSLALRWAREQAPKRLFIAPCIPDDAEMTARVALHKAERGKTWECLEEGLEPREALQAYFSAHGADRPGVLLFDCVSSWLANMLREGLKQEQCLIRIAEFTEYLGSLRIPAALVSAEAGLGLVPPNRVGRRFQDALGLANQHLARACSSAVFVSCGLPLLLKGRLPEQSC
jgi:adenosylcobinamide kinase/adenosylcobinamide-phosphate guanylyltransferase